MDKGTTETKKHHSVLFYVVVAAMVFCIQAESPEASSAKRAEWFSGDTAAVRDVPDELQHDLLSTFFASHERHSSQDDPIDLIGQPPFLLLAGIRRRRIIRGEPLPIEIICDENEGPKWVQIAIEGEWKGHPQGEFKLTRQVFDQMVGNYEAGGRDIVADYEHASSIPGKKAPAAGWIKGLRAGAVNGKAALDALVDWTKDGIRDLEAKSYRYISPGFDLDSKDKHTGRRVGARLTHIALTNRPFIDELPPITLTEEEELLNEEKEMDSIKAIAKKLGLSESATVEDICIKLDELQRSRSDLHEVMGALELKETTTVKDVVGAIMRLKNPADRASALELKEVREKLQERDARDAVQKGVTEGKITPTQQKWAKEYALKDPAGFEEWLAAAPVIVPLSPVPRPKSKAATELSEYQTRLCAELGITKEQFLAEGYDR